MTEHYQTLVIPSLPVHPREVRVHDIAQPVKASTGGHVLASHDKLYDFVQALATGDYEDVADVTWLANQAAIVLAEAKRAREVGYE